MFRSVVNVAKDSIEKTIYVSTQNLMRRNGSRKR